MTTSPFVTATSPVISPVTAQQIGEVGSASVEETDTAIARAQSAFGPWRDLAPGERARLLRAFAAVVDLHLEELRPDRGRATRDTRSATHAGRRATSATA